MNTEIAVPDAASATMTSREIAELTSKRHDHVLRDIDGLLETLNPELGNGFKSSTYTSGDPPREYRMFMLDQDSVYCLVAGYDANSRMRIIKRWQELEDSIATPIAKAAGPALIPETLRAWKEAAEFYGLTGNQAILSAEKAVTISLGFSPMRRLGITHLVANEEGQVFTPTELGKLMTPPVSAVKFNQLLEATGLQSRVLGTWTPTSQAKNLYEWADTGKQHNRGTPVKQLRWFKTVLAVLNQRLVLPIAA